MIGTIVDITWFEDVPIATVKSSTGDRWLVHLLHDAVVKRYKIYIGSQIHARGPLLVGVGNVTERTQVRTEHIPTDIFSEWFRFRSTFSHLLGHRTTRLLFLANMRSANDLRNNLDTLENIHGIGRKSVERVRRSLTP